MGNGATISRSAGSLSAAPTFGTTIHLTYTGSSALTTGPELRSTVNKLTINDTGGVTLSQNVTVADTLSLTSGYIVTGANTLTVDSTVARTTPSTVNYVIGNLQKKVLSTGTSITETYDVGTTNNSNEDYTPIKLVFANVSAVGYVLVRADSGNANRSTSALDN